MYTDSLYPTPNSNEMTRKYERINNAAKSTCDLKNNSMNLKNWAILDSGASSHFLLATAPVKDKMIAKVPLTVKLPNGEMVQSSHMAALDI